MITAADNRKVKMFALLLFTLIFISIFSALAFADLRSTVAGAVSSTGARIGNIFNFDAENPGFIDFAIFFLIFFSLSWLGFSKWFEQQQGAGKGAIIGLSLGISIAFAAALVYAAKFGIGKLLTFAVIFLGIALFILLYVLMDKMLKADSVGKKILAAIIALILTLIIIIVGVSYLAGEGVCEKNSILRKVCGSESIFSRLAEGAGTTTVTPVTPTPVIPVDQTPAPPSPSAPDKPANLSIPPEIQSQLDQLEKEVAESEQRLNRAILDEDLQQIRGVRYNLELYKTRIETIISTLAVIRE